MCVCACACVRACVCVFMCFINKEQYFLDVWLNVNGVTAYR